MEGMIKHETNPLNEEKQLLSEISTLSKLRDQISSNVYSENEENTPFDQIVHMEMQLKVCVSMFSFVLFLGMNRQCADCVAHHIIFEKGKRYK